MAAADTHGWQTGRSLLDCHKYMLENHVACDVTFMFPTPSAKSVTITAHAYMLRCRSAVFDAMLSGNFLEKSDVTVTDIEPDVFMEVLRYMYYDEASLTCHNVLHVLFAAKKYLLEELVNRCQTFLKSEMSVDNVCTILSHCVRYDETALIADCVDFVTSYADSVVDSEDFLELSQNVLLILLRNDDFCLANEMDLFGACMKWAKKQNGDPNVRKTLGEAFFQIRFLMLQPADILCIKAEYPNILSDKETLWLLHRLINQNNPTDIQCDMTQYNFDVRLSKRIVITNRFKYTGVFVRHVEWNFKYKKLHRISFTCSKDVLFRGITVYGGCENNDTHSVTMKLLREGTTLSKTTKDILSDGKDTPIEILVNKPVRLNADMLYTVDVDTFGPSTFYGEFGETSVTCDDLTITYKEVTGNNNSTSVNAGQIPQIIISRI